MSRQANDFATMFMKMMAVMSQQTPGGFPGFPFLTPTPAPTSRSVLNRKLSGSSSEDISPEARSKEKKKREKKRSRSFNCRSCRSFDGYFGNHEEIPAVRFRY